MKLILFGFHIKIATIMDGSRKVAVILRDQILSKYVSVPDNVITRHWLWLAVAAAMVAAVVLPLNLLWLQPLHHDEALYATWGLHIASGVDVWLSEVSIDKPPLFIYLVAAAQTVLGNTQTTARLPSLVASSLTVLMTFLLARRLYQPGVGLAAGWLVALSPFTLLFAPTAFTDPLLVALVMTSTAAAVYKRIATAGLFLGLAIATKQQAIFFAPLPVTLFVITCWPVHNPKSSAARFTAGLLSALLPLILWNFGRSQPSGFFESSLEHYGGLSLDLAHFVERGTGFLSLLFYGTGSDLLNDIFMVGLPLLLLIGGFQIVRSSAHDITSWLVDWTLTIFVLGFLLLHAVLSFQIWDRYLLGLIPLLAILLARIIWLPHLALQLYLPGTRQPALGPVWAGLILLLITATMLRPVQDAANARYPLGSHSHAVRGIDHISRYLQGQFGADTTLYHHWLGTHWRFYLWRYPYDLQYWATPEDLAGRARAGHLIALPTNQSETPVRIALARSGFRLQPLTRALAPDGSPTIILYQFESVGDEPPSN